MLRLIGGAGLGLVIFLVGIHTMSKTLRQVAGPRLKEVLSRFTTHPLAALATGAFTTAVVQSSSATAATMVGLVHAELLTLEQAFGVILGANIGTTFTGQFLALRLGKVAWPLLITGLVIHLVGRQQRWGRTGGVLAGAGGLFLGMNLMSLALRPLADMPYFTRCMAQIEGNMYWGVLLGLVLTALIQSSSATTGLALALAGEGLIGIAGGVAVVLGSNIGTVTTTLLASIGTQKEARRTAVADLVFNVMGVIIILAVMGPFLALVQSTSGDVVHQLANAHTLFNLLTALVAIPLLPTLVRLVRWLVP